MRIAVENAHQTLAVADQLACAPLIERRLVTLHCMSLGKEPRQGLGSCNVELSQRRIQQPIEVAPAERPVNLLDQLEELGHVRDGDELARVPHYAHVEAPRVTGKAVVRGVTVERLPGAVGRVVVAKAPRRPRPCHDERPRGVTHPTLNLERNSITEAFGVAGDPIALGAEGSHAEDLNFGVQYPR